MKATGLDREERSISYAIFYCKRSIPVSEEADHNGRIDELSVECRTSRWHCSGLWKHPIHHLAHSCGRGKYSLIYSSGREPPTVCACKKQKVEREAKTAVE